MIQMMRAALVIGVIVLAGCVGGGDPSFSRSADTSGIVDRWRTPTAKAPELPAITPQFIADLTTSALEITLEKTGRSAVFSPFSDRSGPDRGALRVWGNADGPQIVLRDGVLIATRGLGDDIGSTQSQDMQKFVTSRKAGSGSHQVYLITPENGTERIDLTCDMKNAGSQTLAIVHRAVETIYLRADCRRGDFGIGYEFWVDPVKKTVWQSRQWAGPSLGFVRMRLLKD